MKTFITWVQNIELPFNFVKDSLFAKKEADEGKLTPYVRGKR